MSKIYLDVPCYEKRADQLSRAFESMGLQVRRESSRVSRSEYVEVESKDYTESDGRDGKLYKFRVSDHELPSGYERPDFEVIADNNEHQGMVWNNSGTWFQAVRWLGRKEGIEPKGNAKRMLRDMDEAEERRRVSHEQQTREFVARAKANRDRYVAWLKSLPVGAKFAKGRRGGLVAVLDGNLINKFDGISGNDNVSGPYIESPDRPLRSVADEIVASLRGGAPELTLINNCYKIGSLSTRLS